MKIWRTIFLIFCCNPILQSFAGVEPTVSSSLDGKYFINYTGSTDFIANASFYNAVGNFNTTAPYSFPSNQQIRKINNLLKLAIDADAQTYIDFAYSLQVKVEVTAFLKGLNTPTVFFETLNINYNPTERSVYNESASIHFTNAGKINYKVDQVLFGSNSTLTDAQKALVAKSIYLGSEINIERYTTFDPNIIPTSIFHHYNNLSNELVIWWNNQMGSEEYELEWAYVDNYQENGSERLPTNLLYNKDYNLNRNATRVRLNANNYAIPMVYERGYIIFRIRHIGIKYETNGDKIYTIPGQWSDANFGSNLNLSTFTHKYKITAPHELDKKNWQINTSYAEEGKRKDVVSYMDGSQRNRQTITGLSTEQVTMVGESIYDYQGRAAIQVLPAPVPVDAFYTTMSRSLKYYKNFNLNTANKPYSKTDFDIDNTSCNPTTAPMSNSIGASNYYSPNNPNKSNENAYIPDAFQYPFAQTKFTPDNTGRIRSQGGVGLHHQLNTNHQTEYYYGAPSQEELFMLFGNEAGEASHYKKNLVKDPNGQLSVSILNLSGNVVATALAGKPPTNVDALPSYQPYAMDVDLLAFNNVDLLNNELTSKQNITVNFESKYTLNYTVSNTAFQAALCKGAQLCLDCVYDLELKIINNYACDEVVFQQSKVVGPFTFNDSSMNVNDICQNRIVSFNSANLPSPFVVTLPIGSYTISKTLRVNTAAADAYVDHYLNKFKTTCSSVYDSILNSQLALIDLDACNIVDSSKTENRCDIAKAAMLADLQPDGQYGQVDWNTNTSVDPTSVFNTSNLLAQPNANWKYPTGGGYFDEDGVRILVNDPTTNTQKYPEQLSTLGDFLAVWQESFASSLLPYHPEYCYLDWCSNTNNASFDYDVNMGLTPIYNDAVTRGYFAPITNDPYFASTAVHYLSNVNGLMNTQLSNFSNSNASMFYMAVAASLQANNLPYANTNVNAWISSPNNANGIADRTWENYRAFYLSKKEEIQYAERVNYAMNICTNKGGYNECIGANPFYIYKNNFASSSGNLSNYFNSKFVSGNQSCSNNRYPIFQNKAMRFPSFQSAFPNVDVYNPNIQTTIQQANDYLNNNNPCKQGKDSLKVNCPPTAMAGDLVNLMNILLARKKFNATDTVTSLLGATFKNDFLPGTTSWSGSYTKKKFTATLSNGKKKCDFTIDLPEGINPETFGAITNIIPDNSSIDPVSGYTFSAIITIKLINSVRSIKLKISNNCYPFSYCQSCKPVASKPIERDKIDRAVNVKEMSLVRTKKCDTCLTINFVYDSNEKLYVRNAARNACDPCNTQIDSAITIPIPNECIEQQTNAAYINAQNAFQMILDSLGTNFKSAYIKHCLEATESFRAKYTDAMYHFTLYYYNQAGNLVKTVPPVGVDKLNSAQILLAISHQKGINAIPVYPNHTFKSEYWYNSLEQLRKQTHPDQDGESFFFYDYLGRLIASQNPEQKTQGKYSYTLYDALGRIVEVGELKNVPNVLVDAQARNPIQFASWVNNSVKTQLTKTQYDVPFTSVVNTHFAGDIRNYRGRVASSMYFETNTSVYTNATHYQYDIHGNVKRLVQDLVKLPAKLMEYEYDLISGKVNRLNYQPGKSDQYIHAYFYDADNRITQVQTSRDGFTWENDAAYKYYKHGPLARMVIGENKVQAQDFVYTIQGWIKGVNSPTLDVKTDPGHDAAAGANALIAKDAMGYMLRYFTDDYKPIGSNFLYEPTYTNTAYHRQNKDLYNGNIQSMITSIASPKNSNVAMGTLATAYTYDQLNRIKGMQTYTGPNIGGINNSFVNSAGTTNFLCAYSYDANGNLLTLNRNSNTSAGPLQMDQLRYNYIAGSNKLSQVNDPTPAGNYPDDIDGQNANNYLYDKIGNLIKDIAENLDITWTVYGKIKTVKKGNSLSTYSYGPTGSRIIKEYFNASINTTTTTFYVKDANDNVLATYETNVKNYTAADIQLQSLYVYGSARLGELKVGYKISQLDSIKNIHSNRWYSYESRGLKYYELSNHLGNVLATISDRKLADNPGDHNPIKSYQSDLWMATDYYPFGSSMPGRSYAASSYKFGFNGKENDNDIKGSGNQQDYGMRVYDPRLGKFLSVDPLMKDYAWYTPYQFAGNKPIMFIDLDGCEESEPKPIKLKVYSEKKDNTALPNMKPVSTTKYKIEPKPEPLKLYVNLTNPPNASKNENQVRDKLLGTANSSSDLGNFADFATASPKTTKTLKGVGAFGVALESTVYVYDALNAPSGSKEEYDAITNVQNTVGKFLVGEAIPPIGAVILLYEFSKPIIALPNSKEVQTMRLNHLKKQAENGSSKKKEIYESYLKEVTPWKPQSQQFVGQGKR